MNRFKQIVASLLLPIIILSGGYIGAKLTNSYNIVYAVPKAKKDYTVYITNTGGKYHTSGCRYLKKSKIAIKKSSAVNSGYEPCKVCRS